jgi:Mce-associated membrane protein
MAQNSSSGPTWYDILGIKPEATPEQIKAAWRNATDKFEPGTGAAQFRLFNEAADVLMDSDKRAAYDAEIGVAPTAPFEAVAAQPAAEPPAGTPVPDAPSAPTPLEPAEPAAGIALETKIVAVIAVLAVASLVLAAIFGVRLQHRVNTRQDDANSAAEASAVAERALTAVLSFDYRHMDADRDRSVKFLTKSYGKEFLKTFDLLVTGPNGAPGGAVKTKAVVTANVLGTAVQDATKNKVRVLVFVNQSSVKGSGSPSIFQNRVVATLVRSGDDWLIDDVKSY